MSEEPHRLQEQLPRTGIDAQESFAGLGSYKDGELVIGLVGAVGTDFRSVVTNLSDWLTNANYEVKTIRVSTDIIAALLPRAGEPSGEFERVSWAMTDGDDARRLSGDNSILALGAASRISRLRDEDETGNPIPARRCAYIINSLKHPDEIYRLREIYPLGFYAVGIHSEKQHRKSDLVGDPEDPEMLLEQADELIQRDADEHLPYGQRVTDTFHLSDFFVRLVDDHVRVKNELGRLLQILFGAPYKTPTFDEYAMFLAFASSLRSADMSRQVGAVIANEKQHEIISTGANDCPAFGGGLYWPEYNPDENVKKIEDKPNGRDYTRGRDLNKAEQQEIIADISNCAEKAKLCGDEIKLNTAKLGEVLQNSRITELTEFGRAVHAEMEALLACARKGVSTRGATLYCTTFPCHNCAKHIIAAGIHRVVFIEPYEKSKAEALHDDAMKVGFSERPIEEEKLVRFEPFVGVGPRHFLDLFSMRIGSGWALKREDENSQAVNWARRDSQLRIQMPDKSYLDNEVDASLMFETKWKVREKSNGARGQNPVGS